MFGQSTGSNMEIVLTDHARKRMNERDFTYEDIQFILAYGESSQVRDNANEYMLTFDTELSEHPLFYRNFDRCVRVADGSVVLTVFNKELVL
jgi:hypothetical protein